MIYSTDDDCDVDVETLSEFSRESTPVKIEPPACGKPRFELLVLPAAHSMSAQVAAMHNYSSTLSPPPTPVSPAARSHTAMPFLLSRTFHTTHRASASSSQSSAYFSVVSAHRVKRRGVVIPNRPSSSSMRRRRPGVERAPGARGKKRCHYQRDTAVSTLAGSAGCSDDSGAELNKRAMHNVLERKRRNNLKEYFNMLREEVGSLRAEPRSSKVIVLQRAREYIDELKAVDRRNQTELSRQQRCRDELLRKIAALPPLGGSIVKDK